MRLAGARRAVPQDQRPGARLVGGEQALHGGPHRARVVARDVRPLGNLDGATEVLAAAASLAPEPHRNPVVGGRLGAQRVRQALGRAADRRGVAARHEDVAVRAGAGEQRDAALVEAQDGGMRAVLGPRDLHVAEGAQVAEVDAAARDVPHVDVDEALALHRRQEHVLDERIDGVLGGLAGFDGTGRRRCAQQRAVLVDEEVQRREAVRGHGHVSSRGRGRTSAAHRGRPAQRSPRRSVRSRGQV